MLIQFTPQQVAEQWNELWPLIREGLPLPYMKRGDGIGILGGLLANQLQVFGVIEENAPLFVKGASAILLTAVQGDKFAGALLLYIYSYNELKPYSDKIAQGIAEGLLEAASQLNARCIICPCALGSLNGVMPEGGKLQWMVYELEEN